MKHRLLYSGILIIFFILFLQQAFAFTTNRITSIVIKGNENISCKMIMRTLKMKEGDVFSDELVQSDVNNIYLLGYFADVGADVVDDPIRRGKKVIFKVVENVKVKEVNICGNKKLPTSAILKVMKTRPGRVFNIPVLNEDIKNISKLYAKKGYMFSGVSNMEVKDEGEIINIEITEAIIGKIKIEGNTKTKDWVIKKMLLVKEGDIFSSKRVLRSLQRIFNLGFFKTVKPRYSYTKDKKLVLTILVEEAKTGAASFGGGYSSTNGFVGFLEVREKNLFGKAMAANARVEVGGITTYRLGFYNPWFYKDISLGVDLYNTKIERDEVENGQVVSTYDEKRKGGALLLGKATSTYTRVSMRFRDEKVEIDPKAGRTPQGTGGELQTLTLKCVYDNRDNVLKPRRGRRDSVTIETTGGFLKGKDHFTLYTLNLQRYFALSKRVVLAFRGIGGIADVREGVLPIYEEFGVGGSTTLRGYRTREFTGDKMAIFNTEFRYDLAKKLTGVVFVDYGDAWGLHNRPGSDFKMGMGVGVIFNSPIGPIRIDYGKPVGESGRGGRTYFNMGSIF